MVACAISPARITIPEGCFAFICLALRVSVFNSSHIFSGVKACYFNTGSEWIVHDEEAEPESPEDINGYSVYCIGWNDELIKLEIAEAAECKPEEVVMYAFKDYARIPIYEAV